MLAPPIDGDAGSILALLEGGESWLTSALACALGSSQRTVQRALRQLEEGAAVRAVGRGRSPPLTRAGTRRICDPPRIRPLSRHGPHPWRDLRRRAGLVRPRREHRRARSRERHAGPRVAVAADVDTAFDGEYPWQLADDRIQKVDPRSDQVVATISAPSTAATRA